MRQTHAAGGKAVRGFYSKCRPAQAEEDHQRYVTADTARRLVTRHAQNGAAKDDSHRCSTVATWTHPRCDGLFHPETNGVKVVRTGI